MVSEAICPSRPLPTSPERDVCECFLEVVLGDDGDRQCLTELTTERGLPGARKTVYQNQGFSDWLYLGDALRAIADPPPRLTGSAAATMPPSGRNSMAVAAPISAADVNASPDGVN